MKNVLKFSGSWLALSLLMTIYWIVGLMIGNALFPNDFVESSNEEENASLFMLFVICLINCFVLLFFIQKTRYSGWRLIGTLFLITFGIQFFMAQIEAIWFNDSLHMPIALIWAVTFGGAIMSFLFAITATLMMGKMKAAPHQQLRMLSINKPALVQRVALLSVLIWPLVYFLAGYLIAWQFKEVRSFYTGTEEMAPFLEIMTGNVTSGLYFFQIFRGVLWVLIAWLVLTALSGNAIQKGIILGLLLSFLGSSQLLLPNPIMPEMVRLPHLLETSTSSFLWGYILSLTLSPFIIQEKSQITA